MQDHPKLVRNRDHSKAYQNSESNHNNGQRKLQILFHVLTSLVA
ncbi:hypothetical protein SX4_0287 [Vibrio mimicus SX-4]|nr:hypothetical protein SX4_0287 [Vibrio mimicus SX-4]